MRPSFQWKTRSEVKKDSYGTGYKKPSGSTWEQSRYEIETSMRLHANGNGKEKSYIDGYRYRDWVNNKFNIKNTPLLRDHEIVLENEEIFVVRKPMPSHMKHHQPAQPITYDAADSEQDRLNMLVNTKFFPTTTHASVCVRSRHRPYVPGCSTLDRSVPDWYVCHHCGVGGHYKQDCPKLSDQDFKPVGPRKRATGIPTSFLRTPMNQEESRRAFMDPNGVLKVPID